MMCKEVLPKGIMGLMITGMIFATTDSVNASLNVSSAVFTNDVYRRLYPKAKDKGLMWVARLSTLLFGVITVGVALMVPAKAAIRTVGYALLGVGSMIFVLGLIASIGKGSVLSVATIIVLLGLLCVYPVKRPR